MVQVSLIQKTIKTNIYLTPVFDTSTLIQKQNKELKY